MGLAVRPYRADGRTDSLLCLFSLLSAPLGIISARARVCPFRASRHDYLKCTAGSLRRQTVMVVAQRQACRDRQPQPCRNRADPRAESASRCVHRASALPMQATGDCSRPLPGTRGWLGRWRSACAISAKGNSHALGHLDHGHPPQHRSCIVARLPCGALTRSGPAS